MKARTRIARILLSLIALSIVLVAGFSIALPAITRWGATDEEVAMTLPGDKLLAKPLVDWTTATTINARPDQVWSWIAQIGDTRGGFYSYAFIEMMQNMMQGIQQRAEGVGEPPYIETIEIILWLAAFAAGLAAAGLFVVKRDWRAAALVTVASAIVVLVLTIVQPAIWVRVVMDVLLWIGVVWSFGPRHARVSLKPEASAA